MRFWKRDGAMASTYATGKCRAHGTTSMPGPSGSAWSWSAFSREYPPSTAPRQQLQSFTKKNLNLYKTRESVGWKFSSLPVEGDSDGWLKDVVGPHQGGVGSRETRSRLAQEDHRAGERDPANHG